MELELWSETSSAIGAAPVDWSRHPRDQHSTALIVRVYHWAASHDRPISWACSAANWHRSLRPLLLPDQSTVSRRTRRPDFWQFLTRVAKRLNGRAQPAMLKVIDGKALELPNHSADRDATWSRGVSRMSLGYKIHAIVSGNPMPDAWVITTLNVCEKQMARRMIKRVGGLGYLLGDAHYDASWLFDYCHNHDHQLVCPRAKPFSGERHHYLSPHRRRSIAMLEVPRAISCFGHDLYQKRTGIERSFSQMVCFGAGWARCRPGSDASGGCGTG